MGYAKDLQTLYRFCCLMWKRIERVGGAAEGIDADVAPLKGKPPEPPHRCPLIPLGVPVAQHKAYPQRILEPYTRQLPRRGQD